MRSHSRKNSLSWPSRLISRHQARPSGICRSSGITSGLRLRTNLDNRVLAALNRFASLSVPATFRGGMDSGTPQKSKWVGTSPFGINDSPTALRAPLRERAWPASLCRGVPQAGDSHLPFSQMGRDRRAFCRAMPSASRDKTRDAR